MGQQQLLLVILVTILVGIATVVAINVFGSAAEQGNRDAVRQDLLQGSAAAQGIWARPVALGGTSGNFLQDPPSDDQFSRLMGIPGTINGLEITNENAVYEIVRTADRVTITADPATYGNEIELRLERNPDAGGVGEDPWNITLQDGDDQTVLSGAGVE